MASLMKFDSTLDLAQLAKLGHAARERLLDALVLRHLRAHLATFEAAPPTTRTEVSHAPR